MDELKSMGIELMVSIWPTVDVNSENYEEMKELGLLVRSERANAVQMQFMGNEYLFDAFNPCLLYTSSAYGDCDSVASTEPDLMESSVVLSVSKPTTLISPVSPASESAVSVPRTAC